MVRRYLVLATFAACAALFIVPVMAQQQAASARPRVVITADPELDDNNTLIRALLYSSDFTIEGLVYASSQFHWRGDGRGTTQYIPGREYTRAPLNLGPQTSWRWASNERFIDDLVDAYTKVYTNLTIHHAGYPSPSALRAKIKWGNVDFDGDYSTDTDGSNLIKSLLLDNRPGPLFVTAQGGQSTIARALKSIHDQFSGTPRWNAVREKVSRKLVIVPSGDQDGTGARYIRPNWPDVTYWEFGGVSFGYGATGGSPENAVYVSADWTRENVSSRGPLGALYRVWGDGKQMVKGDRTDYFGLTGLTADELRGMGYYVWTPPGPKGAFIGEGDTPTFLNFIDIGLRTPAVGNWGGWGGRLRPQSPVPANPSPSADGPPGPNTPVGPDFPGYALGLAAAGSTANVPTAAPPISGRGPASGAGRRGGSPALANAAAINARFFAAAQHDFAARLKWSVSPRYRNANHAPSVKIAAPRERYVRPGAAVRIRGIVSDPDGNQVTAHWWQDKEAGTFPGDIAIAGADSAATTFRVPADATPGQTIHVILEGTDDGAPTLTRYQRVVLTVR
jgi:hypothetical protein